MWFRRRAMKIVCRAAKFFGTSSPRCSCHDQPPSLVTEQQERHEGRLAYGFPSRKFIGAVKQVRTVNQKLVAFERGFISENGIPDREWYRHLGVAPGKWLGYGATTLPALTESLTLDKNSTLAKYETARLNCLIKRLVQEIRI